VIRTLAALLTRSLLDVGLVLVAVAALFGYLGYRITRRIITTGTDPLEELSGRLATGLRFLAAVDRRRELDLDDEPDDEDVIRWEEMVP
jgi:hypothetical protein